MIPPGCCRRRRRSTFDGRVVVFCARGQLWPSACCSASCRRGRPQERRSCRRSPPTADRDTRGGRFRACSSPAKSRPRRAPAVRRRAAAAHAARRSETYDPGIARRRYVLTLDFSLPPARAGTRYPTFQSLMPFYDEVAREVSGIPGVATWMDHRFAARRRAGSAAAIRDRRRSAGRRTRQPSGLIFIVSPGYFTTLDLPIVAGRVFHRARHRESTAVCIVNEAFVRRFSPAEPDRAASHRIDPLFPGRTDGVRDRRRAPAGQGAR